MEKFRGIVDCRLYKEINSTTFRRCIVIALYHNFDYLYHIKNHYESCRLKHFKENFKGNEKRVKRLSFEDYLEKISYFQQLGERVYDYLKCAMKIFRGPLGSPWQYSQVYLIKDSLETTVNYVCDMADFINMINVKHYPLQIDLCILYGDNHRHVILTESDSDEEEEEREEFVGKANSATVMTGM